MTIYDQRGQQVGTQYNAARDIIINPPPQRTPQEQRNRQRLLTKVRQFWVAGVLDHSLHGAALIDLGLEYEPDAVTHPWAVVIQDATGIRRQLASGTPIRTVFAEHRELLILGAPGSGKTTLLLELARDLLVDAEQDEAHPMPVVFNLSSWATRRRPLVEWLIDELNERYDVPRAIGRAWVAVDEAEILPLLDGLDEVQQEHRTACVDAINTFHREHGTLGLVVCSRQVDYEVLKVRLKLAVAVQIQPLTLKQVDTYLKPAGEQLAALRRALRSDPELQELAASPLMLSMMTVAYRGVSSDALQLSSTVKEQRGHLFAAYINRMFARRGIDTRYTREQTIRWLGWLAYAMMEQSQSVFLIERLQPDWLPTRAARWQYTLLDRLGSGLVVGLGYGLIVGVVDGLGLGLLSGLVTGMVSGLFGGNDNVRTDTRRRTPTILTNILQGWLVFGVVFGLISGVYIGLGDGLFSGLISGAFFGLFFGVYGGLAGAFAGRPDIRPRQIIVVEALHWSWFQSWRLALIGLIAGLVFGPLAALTDWLAGNRGNELFYSLIFGPLFGLLLGLVGGLRSGEVEAKVRPNQGIWRSARRATQVGLVIFLGFRLIAFFGIGLRLGPILGLLGGLTYGGYACLSHFSLRLIIWWRGYLPWRIDRFLNYGSDRIFLRKVGGGYIFVHRLLLEYFATLDTTRGPPSVPEPAQENLSML